MSHIHHAAGRKEEEEETFEKLRWNVKAATYKGYMTMIGGHENRKSQNEDMKKRPCYF
jgi:hypothetical protein